jgi:DHA1 family multidrug resistance protein-like MFS transporter
VDYPGHQRPGLHFHISIFPAFFQELGVGDPARAAFLTGVSAWGLGIGYAVSGPIWGMLGDRYGRRKNILRATLLGGSVLFLSGLAQTQGQLILSRVLVGATAGIGSTTHALVAAHTPRSQLAFAVGLMQSSLFLSTALGPLVGGFIFDQFGMRPAFMATGGTIWLAGLLAFALTREDFQRPSMSTGGDLLAPFKQVWRMATSRYVLPLLAMVALVQGSVQLAIPVLPVLVQEIQGGVVKAGAAGLAFAAIGFASVVSAVVAGYLGTRIGPKWVLVGGCVISSGRSIPLFFAQSVSHVVLFVGAVGLFSGGLAGMASVLVALSVPSRRQGVAFGSIQTATAVATGMGPFLGGWFAVIAGIRSVFLLNALLFCVTAAMAVTLLGRASIAPEQDEEAGSAGP